VARVEWAELIDQPRAPVTDLWWMDIVPEKVQAMHATRAGVVMVITAYRSPTSDLVLWRARRERPAPAQTVSLSEAESRRRSPAATDWCAARG
jgi:hypothetical protein